MSRVFNAANYVNNNYTNYNMYIRRISEFFAFRYGTIPDPRYVLNFLIGIGGKFGYINERFLTIVDELVEFDAPGIFFDYMQAILAPKELHDRDKDRYYEIKAFNNMSYIPSELAETYLRREKARIAFLKDFIAKNNIELGDTSYALYVITTYYFDTHSEVDYDELSACLTSFVNRSEEIYKDMKSKKIRKLYDEPCTTDIEKMKKEELKFINYVEQYLCGFIANRIQEKERV